MSEKEVQDIQIEDNLEAQQSPVPESTEIQQSPVVEDAGNNKRRRLTTGERQEIAKRLVESAATNGIDFLNYDGKHAGDFSTDAVDTSNPEAMAYAKSLKWYVSEYGDIHIAGLLPTQTSGYKYLQDAKNYSIDFKENWQQVIELSRKAAKYEGIVVTGLEALCEIPTLGGWYIDCPDEEMSKNLVYWLEHLGAIEQDENPLSLDHIQQIGGVEQFGIKVLWGLYEDGDKIITEKWDNVLIPTTGKKLNVPTKFYEHDVLECEIDEAAAKIGLEIINVRIDEDIKRIVKADAGSLNEKDKKILENIHPDLIKQIKESEEDTVPLPPAFTTHFSRRNNFRDTRGIPYTVKCFPALAYKHRLRALDNATIDGLIQRIWIIKIGVEDVNSPLHEPDDTRVLLAVSAFRNLKTNNFMIWPGPDLQKEELASSDQNILSFQDRYKNADEDILYSLGIPRLILDGTSAGTQSRDWSVFVKTLSQMERYQIMLKRWIERKMRQICIQNGKKDLFPKFEWMMMKMQDREKAKNVVTKLREMNLLGRRRSLYLLGLDGHGIIEEMIAEKKENLDEKIGATDVPPQPGRPDGTPDGGGDNPNKKNKKPDPDSNRDNMQK